MNPQTPQKLPPKISFIAFVVLTLMLVATLLAWHNMRHNLFNSANSKFEVETGEIEAAIKKRMEIYKNTVIAGRAFFNATGDVTRPQWNRFVSDLNISRDYPGIQGIGFAKYVPKEKKEEHILEIRGEGFSDYAIKPGGNRQEYVPIIYLEPFEGNNLNAFGFDIFSEEARRSALIQARDTGEPVLTSRVRLVQEIGQNEQGFLLYAAVYSQDAQTVTPQQRKKALIGYANAPFQMNNFMQGILGEKVYDITFEIFDGKAVDEKRRLFTHDGGSIYP